MTLKKRITGNLKKSPFFTGSILPYIYLYKTFRFETKIRKVSEKTAGAPFNHNTIVHYFNRELLTHGSDICLFASFSYIQQVDDYVLYYLKKIKECGFLIVFISGSPVNEKDLNHLKELCHAVIEKENDGLDFGSWHAALEILSYAANSNSVLLLNDSVFGPLYDLKQVFNLMEEKKFDIWGMIDGYLFRHHIQSWFLYFNKKAIQSRAWADFWKKCQSFKQRELVVYNYEISLKGYFEKNGFKVGSLIECSELIERFKRANNGRFPELTKNYCLLCWDYLISEYSFPFLKRELFKDDFAFDIDKFEVNKFESVIRANTDYDVDLIKNYFLKHQHLNTFRMI